MKSVTGASHFLFCVLRICSFTTYNQANESTKAYIHMTGLLKKFVVLGLGNQKGKGSQQTTHWGICGDLAWCNDKLWHGKKSWMKVFCHKKIKSYLFQKKRNILLEVLLAWTVDFAVGSFPRDVLSVQCGFLEWAGYRLAFLAFRLSTAWIQWKLGENLGGRSSEKNTEEKAMEREDRLWPNLHQQWFRQWETVTCGFHPSKGPIWQRPLEQIFCCLCCFLRQNLTMSSWILSVLLPLFPECRVCRCGSPCT